jgi:dTDP-4-dehydrorhamnose 3,5-epimerase
MTITPGTLSGIWILEPQIFGDARGWFLETWNRRRYAEAGIDIDFVQDNVSLSRLGVLRGLHFQNPSPQGKLVTVLAGEVFDVAVDLRRASSTFGQWESVVLTGENKRQVYLPPGFAHGFQVTSDTALVHYKCTAPYKPDAEVTLRWDDPDLAVSWPISNPVVSAKDAAGPRLRELLEERLFKEG